MLVAGGEATLDAEAELAVETPIREARGAAELADVRLGGEVELVQTTYLAELRDELPLEEDLADALE